MLSGWRSSGPAPGLCSWPVPALICAADTARRSTRSVLAFGSYVTHPFAVPNGGSACPHSGVRVPAGCVAHQGGGQLRVGGSPHIVEQIPLLVSEEAAGMHRHLGDVPGHVDDAPLRVALLIRDDRGQLCHRRLVGGRVRSGERRAMATIYVMV